MRLLVLCVVAAAASGCVRPRGADPVIRHQQYRDFMRDLDPVDLNAPRPNDPTETGPIEPRGS